MSQFDKLLKRIKSLDKNMRFDELQKAIPQNNPIKKPYVELVKELNDGREEFDENNWLLYVTSI